MFIRDRFGYLPYLCSYHDVTIVSRAKLAVFLFYDSSDDYHR